MSEAEDKFGKKGATNAALTTGIIGTSLGVLNSGLFGGLFGGNSNANCPTNPDSQACAFVNKDTFWRQNVELEKELGVQRYDSLKANYDLYITLDNKISALQQSQAITSAQLPLMFQLANVTSERYTDDKVYAEQLANCRHFGAIEYQLAQKLNGTMGFPYSSLITGVPKMCEVSLDCTCGKA